uniref:Uncharacterized protein n=1 Tax=viral metagenome TaxID=1070528 RepID=A0A6H1ZPN9_9ZZZZ
MARYISLEIYFVDTEEMDYRRCIFECRVTRVDLALLMKVLKEIGDKVTH